MIGHFRDRLSPRALDVLLVLTVLVVSVAGSAGSPENFGTFALTPVLTGIAGSASLLLHRTHPRSAALLATTCSLVLALTGFQLNPFSQAASLVSLCLLAMHTNRRTARISTAAAAGVLVLVSFAVNPDLDWGIAIGLVSWTLLPGAIGDTIRTNREYVAAFEARAEIAERTREEEALLRVSEERMRMARELHDVVAHHVALASTQARAARYLMQRHPERVPEVLNNLCDATDEALAELRVTVGLLRQRGDTDSPRDPAPGLGQLPALLESFERAGLNVDVTREGDVYQLSPGVDLTAYRIIQEALTNVAKHAGTDHAAVHLQYERNSVVITVVDEGGPLIHASRHGRLPGFGLIGMRERAQSVGGRMEAGHRSEGGFAVTVKLPLRTATQQPSSPEEAGQ